MKRAPWCLAALATVGGMVGLGILLAAIVHERIWRPA